MTVTIFFQDCSYLVVPLSRLAQPWQGLLAQWYAFAESHVFDARRRGRKEGKKRKGKRKKKGKEGGLAEHDAVYCSQDKMVSKTTKHCTVGARKVPAGTPGSLERSPSSFLPLADLSPG